MWRTEWLLHHRSLLISSCLLLTQALAGCGGGTSVAICASTGPNNNFCSGFGSSGGDSKSRTAASVETFNAPAGLYSIDQVVDRAFVDGVALHVSWVELEPEQGEYRFEKIAQMVTSANELQQQVTLVIQLDVIPEWLSIREQSEESDDPTQDALSHLVDALGRFELDGIGLRDHVTISLLNIAGYESTGMTLAAVINILRSAFSDIPISIETENIPGPSESELAAGVFWLYKDFSTPSTMRLVREDDERPVLLRACGAWSAQQEWPDCSWAQADIPDTALAYAVQQYGATYFEFRAADLESVEYYSQFEYWSSAIRSY